MKKRSIAFGDIMHVVQFLIGAGILAMLVNVGRYQEKIDWLCTEVKNIHVVQEANTQEHKEMRHAIGTIRDVVAAHTGQAIP